MQLTVTSFLSVDGVHQGPGGPDADRGGGFDRGGWAVPHFDEATGQFIDAVFGQVDAFLLGRRTYDIFAASWPKATDPNDPVASRIDETNKQLTEVNRQLSFLGSDIGDALNGAAAKARRDKKGKGKK